MGIPPIEPRSVQAFVLKGRDLLQSGNYIPCVLFNGSLVPFKPRAWEINPQVAFHIIFATPNIFQMQKGETLSFVVERPSFNTVSRGFRSLGSAVSSISLQREDDLGPSLIRVFIEGKEPPPSFAQLKSKF